MADVKLVDLKKSYGSVDIIKGVSLDIKHGEFVVFVGPSGCGKSTLLRMISGLEEITDGDLYIAGKRVNDEQPRERGIAMVFQSYAIFPHMTVGENIGFGLTLAGVPKAEKKRAVDEAARILQMEHLLERKPSQLSGGQRQRVAIGRSIVRKPQVFLFDEPLSNLDAALRVDMRMEIGKLHKDLGATMIYVTHDQVEAMTLADKIVVLRAGEVMQVGTPLELYHNPANQFVAGFLGSPKMNFLEVDVKEAGDGRVTVASPALEPVSIPHAVGRFRAGRQGDPRGAAAVPASGPVRRPRACARPGQPGRAARDRDGAERRADRRRADRRGPRRRPAVRPRLRIAGGLRARTRAPVRGRLSAGQARLRGKFRSPLEGVCFATTRMASRLPARPNCARRRRRGGDARCIIGGYGRISAAQR